MRYAKNEQGERIEATPSQRRAFCEVCGSEVLARCGTQRVHHWAHANKELCHFAKEPKTPWHINWQDQFPKDWQEVITEDGNGEKHIADIKTLHGLVVEFQHSYIQSNEQSARESHYKKMVWVVDGTRCPSDFERIRWYLVSGINLIHYEEQKVLNIVDVKKGFPKGWIDRSVPVCFDFKLAKYNEQNEVQREECEDLVVLLPRENNTIGCLKLSRAHFIEGVKDGSLLSFLEEKKKENLERIKREEGAHKHRFNLSFKARGNRCYRTEGLGDSSQKSSNIHLLNKDSSRRIKEDLVKFRLCPQCGSGKLVLRHGPYGEFYGCSNYPKCKKTIQL